MATIRGTAGSDTIAPVANSAGVTGGVPGRGIDTIFGSAGRDLIDGDGGSDLIDYGELTGGVNVTLSLATGGGLPTRVRSGRIRCSAATTG